MNRSILAQDVGDLIGGLILGQTFKVQIVY